MGFSVSFILSVCHRVVSVWLPSPTCQQHWLRDGRKRWIFHSPRWKKSRSKPSATHSHIPRWSRSSKAIFFLCTCRYQIGPHRIGNWTVIQTCVFYVESLCAIAVPWLHQLSTFLVHWVKTFLVWPYVLFFTDISWLHGRSQGLKISEVWGGGNCAIITPTNTTHYIHYAVFAQYLSYCWIMNTDLNWGKWGLQFFRCCSGFFYDLLDESSLHSWSNFGGRPLLGRFTTVTSFLHLWIMTLIVVCWSPKALEMALYPFPDWYMSTILFLICSWIS